NPLSSFHPKTEPKIFIDENDVFMAFLNHLKVIDIINRRLQNSKLINLKDYQEYQDEIHEIFALHMYNTCLQLQSDLDKYNDTPTDETIRELECNMLNYDFKKVMMHGFKMRYTPVRVLKFFNDECGTECFDFSKTNINIDMLNSANLNNIEELDLSEMELTQFPCLSSFKNLRHLYLDHNMIVAFEPGNYFDEETGAYRTMPRLEEISLLWNSTSSIDVEITKVFISGTTKICLNETEFYCTCDSMKKSLKDTHIKLSLKQEDELMAG
ncbi:uncharacterized protein VICG_01210, partial [Vittaforma corneae ATCC 50505]